MKYIDTAYLELHIAIWTTSQQIQICSCTVRLTVVNCMFDSLTRTDSVIFWGNQRLVVPYFFTNKKRLNRVESPELRTSAVDSRMVLQCFWIYNAGNKIFCSRIAENTHKSESIVIRFWYILEMEPVLNKTTTTKNKC